MEQVALAARVVPQAFVPVAMAKSPGLVPPMAMLLMFSVALPVLVSVAVRGDEVAFTVVLGKASAGVNVAAGANAAVMLNVTELDVPPPGDGFVTVTPGVPAVATSVARIAAVTWVALM